MARIISSRKTETIEVIPDDGFNGAHRYRARMCAGFVNGKTKYVDATDTIQFVHKHEDGTITPGLPTMNDGKWEESDDDGIFWSEEDFNDSLNKLFGIVTFPELNKGECVEMELICELKVKTEKCE